MFKRTDICLLMNKYSRTFGNLLKYILPKIVLIFFNGAQEPETALKCQKIYIFRQNDKFTHIQHDLYIQREFNLAKNKVCNKLYMFIILVMSNEVDKGFKIQYIYK